MSGIGVSFPGYSVRPRTLGRVLRLHGLPEILAWVVARDWMGAAKDLVEVSDIAAAPANAEHRSVYRAHAGSSVGRMRRRWLRRHGGTPEDAVAAIPDWAEPAKLDAPFVRLRSTSTGQLFNLFVAVSEPVAKPRGGAFDPYGLSRTATVPWF